MSYKIPTGDFVGQKWDGPFWTPYAQAIADNYPIQVPWFKTVRVDLPAAGGLTPVTRTVTTAPYEHDVLIFGAYITGTDAQVPFIGVQVTHQESGIPWAVNNVLPFIPLSAFGGLNTNAASLFKWPEAFFLPRTTTLKLDFTLIDTSVGNPDAITVTLAGAQLVRNGPAPHMITMPDGEEIRIDSRLPMFLTAGLGRRALSAFTLNANTQDIQYLPPIECDVEIHDASASVICSHSTRTINEDVNLLVKLTIMGIETGWTPRLSPITGVFGGPGATGGSTQIFPALPFTKPFLLPKGHRIQIAEQNNNAAENITNGYLTFRGVRRCEYT